MRCCTVRFDVMAREITAIGEGFQCPGERRDVARAERVLDQGAPTGAGVAQVWTNTAQSTVCMQLQVSGLDRHLPVHDSVDDALTA